MRQHEVSVCLALPCPALPCLSCRSDIWSQNRGETSSDRHGCVKIYATGWFINNTTNIQQSGRKMRSDSAPPSFCCILPRRRAKHEQYTDVYNTDVEESHAAAGRESSSSSCYIQNMSYRQTTAFAIIVPRTALLTVSKAVRKTRMASLVDGRGERGEGRVMSATD